MRCAPRYRTWFAFLLCGGLVGPCPFANAQEAPRGDEPSREAQLEERVRQLESMVERLSGQLERLQTPLPPALPPLPSSATSNPWPGPSRGGPTAGDDLSTGAMGGSGAASSPGAPPPSPRFQMPPPKVSKPAHVKFGPGFEISTEDDEYQLQFHNLTQVDYRGYFTNGASTPSGEFYRSTFGIPRQWWIFSGRLTKSYEFYAVPAFGFDGLNLLDCFININYDERIQVKFGRFKTPFTYEFYYGPINGLINPERSLFFNNFALNREIGAMAWGSLFDKRLDFAAGLFNGARNFFIARSPSPELAAYINFRPFRGREGAVFENFDIGGSVMAGNQEQVPQPNVLRDNVATSGNSFFGVPFLAFNNNVRESGPNALWDLHLAWYYRRLSLIAEYGAGYQPYAITPKLSERTRVPVQSYYVQAGYFLTGENVSGRGLVRPFGDFDPSASSFSPGALELAARYSYLDLGSQVFTAGLADPNLWSDRVWLLDLGVNWYVTQYLKMYFGWQHFEMADPVIYAPGKFQIANDMLWLRAQLAF